jgi:hypothetical protein
MTEVASGVCGQMTFAWSGLSSASLAVERSYHMGFPGDSSRRPKGFDGDSPFKDYPL